jgi:mRNA interferase MazF
VSRGEIWLYRFASPDKRRPVLVLSRDEVIPLIRTVMVVPITSAIRGAPSEVVMGSDEGLKRPCAANLDQVHTVARERLERYIGTVAPARMREVCRALAIATGCV